MSSSTSSATLATRRITISVTPEQRTLLEELKLKVETAGIVTDEIVLMRFLRARKYDVEAAFLQFSETETWRKDNNVAKNYDEFDVEEFKKVQDVYPLFTGRRDKNGSPLYLFNISSLTKEVISEYSKNPDRLETRMVSSYEHMVQYILPFATSVPHSSEAAISSTVTIVDISNVSLKRFWDLRAHMQRASVLANARYAETLGRIYLIGAPSFFSIVFGWISKWFDAQTVDKIFILAPNEVFSTLSKFIDPENIPIAYGGTLEFEFGKSRPNLDQASKDTLGLDELPTGPIRWDKGVFTLKGTGRTEEEIDRFTPKTRKEVNEFVEVIDEKNGVVLLGEKGKMEQELSQGIEELRV